MTAEENMFQKSVLFLSMLDSQEVSTMAATALESMTVRKSDIFSKPPIKLPSRPTEKISTTGFAWMRAPFFWCEEIFVAE